MEEANMSQPEQKTGTAQPEQQTNVTSSQEKADSSLEKFQELLRQLFQFEAADLDFGIYRIMNARRKEIMRFLNDELLPQVGECLGLYERESRAVLQAELEKAKEQAKALGFEDPAQAPKVKELQERYNAAFDIEAAENEVFSHLYNFFRRYYSEGDFISQRRYKEGYEKGPYAIPYHGEEVKLYWANYDQYYIKTSEYLRNYTFKLPSGKRVHFKLVEADTEKDNNRPQNGKERRFILSEKQPLAEENGELVIRFEYRPDPQKRKQAELNAEAVKRILNKIEEFIKQPPEEFKKERSREELKKWQQELASLQQELTSPWSPEKHPNRTLLEKHLADYTARNTFDYFIHKDLGGFLRRELDFYIKNEVMYLDDIESDTAPRVEQYLSKIKAIRRIAHKIIDFLAQLENFQKKLWLKKKFVVETQYCVTLDRVPEELYPEIAANEEQRKEWVRLFAIDKITGDLEKPGYSVPLTVEFLKANPYLVLDTRHFDEDFKRRLLASFDDLDEQCDGLLIHSENFQALILLQERFSGQVGCVYIDPPFNSPSTEILYKNDYKHSSWLSLLSDRLAASRRFITEGVYVVAIDENEMERLGLLLEESWLGSYKKVCVAIRHNPRGIQGRNFSHCHEYAYFMYPSDTKKYIGDRKLEEPDVRNLRDSGLESDRSDARNCFYPIIIRDDSIIRFGEVPSDDYHPRGVNEVNPDGTVSVWPIDTSGNEKKWRYARHSVEEILPKLQVRETRGKYEIYFAKDTGTVRTLWTDAQFDASEYGTKLLQGLFGTRDLDFSYPKSLYTLVETVRVSLNSDSTIMDFFAGSGTTAHAVINLNREDGGRRKYILVEMGEYFDTVLVPRIKKVVYSKDWKDGKPVSREGISHMFKYIRLESYEDTLNNLNNLELKRTEAQQRLLKEHPAFREDYILHYMLEVESRGSPSLLNLDRFEDPFSYKLNIATGTVGETKPTVIDLVETFNYLIGLRVKTIRYMDGVCVVTGTNPQGERVLILWRNTKEMDNDKLDEWFKKQGYHTKGQEFDLIYVNGDNNLENLKKPDQTWRVRLIEKEFLVRMFDVQDV
jgi:adenine-specific DNA-methyltransferase